MIDHTPSEADHFFIESASVIANSLLIDTESFVAQTSPVISHKGICDSTACGF